MVVLAVLAANTPFMNERCFAIIAVQRFSLRKPLWCRAFELLTLYFVVGGIGMLLERNAGNGFQQGWEFYAVTFCLFLVLAFPGFVFRYLRKRHD